MGGFLVGIFNALAVGMVAKVLIGAGLSFVVYVGVSQLVDAYLGALVAEFQNLPTAVLQIMLLAGVGEALSAIGSAAVTVALLSGAQRIAGLKVTG